MSSKKNQIDWDNKPKLRYKWLSIVFFLLGLYLFYFSYGYATRTYQKHTNAQNSTIDMRSIAGDLVNLEVAPLDAIEVNQKKLDLLYNLGLGDVAIEYPDTENIDGPITPNSDNIGNFYRVEVIFFGDMYEQIYFLSKFDLLRDFVLVDSMNANQRNIIIKARLYGQ